MSNEKQMVKVTCVKCGHETFSAEWNIEQPAAGPWNYDMSAAPRDVTLLLLSTINELEIGYRPAWEPYPLDGYIAWAVINLPEAGHDH